MSQRLNSNATCEYSYPVGARNDRLRARGCGLDVCVYIAVVCVYNLVHILRLWAKDLHFSAFYWCYDDKRYF